MYIFVTILIFIVSILLILIVLVQNSKGGGLASNFTGNTQTIGVRNTADFLEKATWTLAGIFFALCILAVYTMPKREQINKSVIEEKAQTVQTINTNTPPPTLP
ncbi:MAG: preprotein translocase subunit SecG, partial [Bacteroidales bacterium]